MDRSLLKEKLLKKYKNKLKADVLQKNIDGLVDEYLETERFIIENGVEIDDLPNRLQMKYWFQDKLPQEALEKIINQEDKMYEANIDEIYIKINSDNSSKKDPLAESIYKKLYNFEWEVGKKLPAELNEILKIHKVAYSISNLDHKRFLETRLMNYALLGAVRFYHLERKPYFNSTELNQIIRHFRLVLDVIYKIESGFYAQDYEIKGSIFLFDAFGKFLDKADPSITTPPSTTTCNEKPPVKPKRKYTKRKPKDNHDGPQQI